MQYLHTMIRVSDVDASLRFFCGLLGFVEIKRSTSERGRFTLIYLAAAEDVGRAQQQDTPLLELTHNWDPEQYSGGRNFGHIALAVDDIYGVCQRLMDGGVKINRPPRDGHMAFVRSPDDISIELLQRGGALPEQEPWLSMPNIGKW